MKLSRLLALAVFVIPVLAHAHPGHDGHELGWDFTSGVSHPLSGLDHLLAMLAVGFWAAQLGGRSRWLVPLAFLGCMALGAMAARSGFTLPGLEQGLSTSILVAGLMIALAVRLPTAASMAVAGGFALFHGMAHGVEMPASAEGLRYGLGFVAATALLHAAGLGLGLALRNRETAVRFCGGAVALAGAMTFAL